jgi:N-methylhydantoinase B
MPDAHAANALPIDSIDRDVFQQALVGIAEEMSSALRRAAYSSIIWDMYDYACGLFTPEGEMLAQARTIAAQLGIMATAYRHMIKAHPLAGWQPGDVYVCNDPYRGCTHTPDVVLFSPVFLEGALVAVTSTIAHHVDIGGKIPCTEAADNVEIFAEGLILPPLKLVDAGRPVQAIFDILAANVRDPRASLGDLRAQIAGCRTGERRIAELYGRHGAAEAQALAAACLDYGESVMRRRIARLPPGRYEAVTLMEDEVASDAPLEIRVAVTVEGESLTVDLTGTSAQRENALNNPYASTHSMVNYALKCLLAPEVAQNEGCIRPLRIIAPPGTLVNPTWPAAVSVRHLTQQALADAVLRALSPAVPERSTAGCHGSFPTIGAGGFDDRPEMAAADGKSPYYIISDIIGGGMGGSPAGDGLSAVDTHGGNCAILSAEVMESLSPFRVERTELIAGSGGAGQARGGLGIRRDYRFLGSRCLLGGYLQQTHAETAPWGAEGGEAGRPAAFILNPGTPGEQRLKSKVYGLALGPGDVLRLEGAGGGGWGDPAKRDARRTAQDRAEGLA